jgi:hypothetical protein
VNTSHAPAPFHPSAEPAPFHPSAELAPCQQQQIYAAYKFPVAEKIFVLDMDDYLHETIFNDQAAFNPAAAQGHLQYIEIRKPVRKDAQHLYYIY